MSLYHDPPGESASSLSKSTNERRISERANEPARCPVCLGDLDKWLGSLQAWKRGESRLELTFIPAPDAEPETITIYPRTLGLYPTQVYETVSMILLMMLLLAYYPFRRAPGQVGALLMIGYGVHRYLNEILRDDPRPEGLESYGSVFLVAAGVLMWVCLWRIAATPPTTMRPAMPEPVPPRA